MPPLFVDGVEIDSVFVDGVEQDNVFVDGVEVFSAEIPDELIICTQALFDDNPLLSTSFGFTLNGGAVNPNTVHGAEINILIYNLIFGGDPTNFILQLHNPGQGFPPQDFFRTVHPQGNTNNAILNVDDAVFLGGEFPDVSAWTWDVGFGGQGNWAGSGNRNVVFTFDQ